MQALRGNTLTMVDTTSWHTYYTDRLKRHFKDMFPGWRLNRSCKITGFACLEGGWKCLVRTHKNYWFKIL